MGKESVNFVVKGLILSPLFDLTKFLIFVCNAWGRFSDKIILI